MTTTTVEPVNGSSVQDGRSIYTTSVFARYKVNLRGRTRGNNNKKINKHDVPIIYPHRHDKRATASGSSRV